MSAPLSAPLIALITDFGTADGYPGVMKGVVLGIAPGVPLIDLTHEIPPQDIRSAAWVLHTSWRSFPPGSVFVCVVDPGVGSERHPLALRAGGCYFVGPDNGLFSHVLAEETTVQVVTIANPRVIRAAPSATFHGRDIFAPAAAWLANGAALDELGPAIASDALVRLMLPQPSWQDGTLIAQCAHIDRFGNILTNVRGALAQMVFDAPAVTLTIAGHLIGARASTFAAGQEGELFLYLDSSGYMAIAQRNGSALAALAVTAEQLYQLPMTITGITPQPKG